MTLNIGYFYPDQLNLYGDNGNVEVLMYRALSRGIKVNLVKIGPSTQIDGIFMSVVNFVFMGGGPDSEQKFVYSDLLEHKGKHIKEYINRGGVGLYICGSYQLLGNYYKSADGSVLKGLGVFDMYTEHFGNHKPRCIGNTLGEVNSAINFSRPHVSLGSDIVGFENHGGRTYLGESSSPFANIKKGFGNNGEDKTEGILYRNSIGSYFHGPLLAKNPHLADYLICKSLGLDDLPVLENDLSYNSHTASKNLKQ